MITHKTFLTRFIIGLLVFFFAFVAVATAQEKQETAPTEQSDEDVLRISTDLVQTDVVVFDKEGRFVDDLKPEQFELKIDGKPQPITFFERVAAWSAREEEQLAAASGVTRAAAKGETSAAPAVPVVQRGRTIIFFIDDMHMTADSIVRARKLINHFIDKEMSADDMVAIASPAGSIGFLQQFTNNKEVLRAAASRLTYQTFAAGDSQRPAMSEFQAQSVDRGEVDVVEYFIEQVLRENPRMPRDMAESTVKQRAERILKQSSAITVNMLGSLDSLMRTSTRLPGRKLVFFISDGFFLNRRHSEAQERMRRVTTTAARAATVIYTVDARGLVTGAPDPTQEEIFDPKGKFARITPSAQISPSQDALNTLAEETGGRVFVNSNALNTGVTNALEEMSRYYLLAWRPDPETNRGGKFRRLEVRVVGRPELKVRARRGFLTEAESTAKEKAAAKDKNGKATTAAAAAPKTADDELRDAMNEILPRKGVPTFLSLNYVDLPEKVSMLTVAVKIPGDALSYDAAADKFGATVDVLGGVFDERGQPVSSFKDALKVSANSTEPESLRNNRVIYTAQVPVKPGLYQVRIATRDARSKRMGGAMEWIEVPDLTKGKLAMSGLFVSELKAGQMDAQAAADAFKLGNLSVDRRLAKTSKLLFLTYIYNAAQAPSAATVPDLVTQIKVFSPVKPILTTVLRKVSTEGLTDLMRIPYSAEIPLKNMLPGRYTLQITTTDRIAKTSTSQSVNFEVNE